MAGQWVHNSGGVLGAASDTDYLQTGQEKICNKHFVTVASWSDTLVLLDFTQKGRHGVQAGMCRPF